MTEDQIRELHAIIQPCTDKIYMQVKEWLRNTSDEGVRVYMRSLSSLQDCPDKSVPFTAGLAFVALAVCMEQEPGD